MRRITSILLSIILTAISLCSCTKGRADDSPVTILVNNNVGNLAKEYFTKLAEGVKKEYGIDVEFVYISCTDGADQLKLEIASGQMPADIVFSSYKLPTEILENTCLNLLSFSHIASYFTYGTIKECTVKGGAAYQLPIASKLIGISYNESVLNEHNWRLPHNFQEMVELKGKCEAAGVPFAFSDLRYTGNGFNYLFHLLGTEWISTIEGHEWLEDFLEGETDVEKLRNHSSYFSKLVENGLLGEPYNGNAFNKFLSSRALFCYTITNQEGREGGDTIKSMPWISEDGSNNCFTKYDNCWILADRHLADPGNEARLEKVTKILDYIPQKEFADFAALQSPDIFLSLNSFDIQQDRLYSHFANEIKAGFLQPWYYNYFNQATIVNAGQAIDSYILDHCFNGQVPEDFTEHCFYDYAPGTTIEKIFSIIEEEEEEEEEERKTGALSTITETLDYQYTAQIAAIGGAIALQQALDAALPDAPEVTVALMPYTETIKDMQPWMNAAVENSRLNPGPFYEEYVYILTPQTGHDLCGIKMTGAQIKQIVAERFDASDHFIDSQTGKSNFDLEHYGLYPYACVTKGGFKLENDVEYLVAVASNSLTVKQFKEFADAGKVLRSPSTDAADQSNEGGTSTGGGVYISGEIVSGLLVFFAAHPTLGHDDISW